MAETGTESDTLSELIDRNEDPEEYDRRVHRYLRDWASAWECTPHTPIPMASYGPLMTMKHDGHCSCFHGAACDPAGVPGIGVSWSEFMSHPVESKAAFAARLNDGHPLHADHMADMERWAQMCYEEVARYFASVDS